MLKQVSIMLVVFGFVVAPAWALAQGGAGTATTMPPGIRAGAKADITGTTTPRDSSGAVLEARLVRAKEKAAQEINRRIAALQKLMERVAAMKRVSTQFKNDLAETIDAEIAKLEALQGNIESSTDGNEIKADVQSITRSYRIFALVMPKAAIAAAADRIVTMTTTLSEIGAKLKVRVDTAAAAGTDVAALLPVLDDLAEKIVSANGHAKAAVDGTMNLQPDNGEKALMDANRAALQKAREELKAAHEDVKAARELVRHILNSLKGTAPSNEPSTYEQEENVQV